MTENKPSETPTGQTPSTPSTETPPTEEKEKQQRVRFPRSRERVPTMAPGEQPEFAKKISIQDLDKDLESELEAAMGGLSDQQLYGDLQAPSAKTPPTLPGPKKGRVIRVHGPDVFVELAGHRTQGVLPILQFPDGPPPIGAEIDVEIEGYDREDGLLMLTRKGAAVEADWSSVAVGMVVEARVTAANKGGLAVMVNNIRAFMPISQIELFRVENLEPYLNQRLLCLVTEVDPHQKNLVVSRRALLEKEREEQRDKLWNELAEGQVREGVVRHVRDFGAFVDLGGVDGLIHVSEMSWKRVQKAEEVVQPGQRVKVIVLKLDRDRRKVSLGLKQLQASPWDTLEQNYPPGSIVHGKVTRLVEFGAFVELEPGLEGLIHISELATHRVRRVIDVVQPGQEIDVMILNIEPERRKIALSLKEAVARKQAEIEAEENEEYEPPPPRPINPNLRGGI